MSKEIIDFQFEAAILEIAEEAQLPLNRDIVERWLSDYEQLWEAKNKEVDLPALEIVNGRNMTEFDSIYRLLQRIKEFYQLEALCEPILAEYRLIMANNPTHDLLETWVRKHEMLGMEDLLVPPIEPGSSNFVRTIYGVTYFIAGMEFKNTTDFYATFSDLFWKQEILPDRIAEIEKKREEATQKQFENNKQRTNNNDLMCDECKKLGACRRYPHDELTHSSMLSILCPYDDKEDD